MSCACNGAVCVGTLRITFNFMYVFFLKKKKNHVGLQGLQIYQSSNNVMLKEATWKGPKESIEYRRSYQEEKENILCS